MQYFITISVLSVYEKGQQSGPAIRGVHPPKSMMHSLLISAKFINSPYFRSIYVICLISVSCIYASCFTAIYFKMPEDCFRAKQSPNHSRARVKDPRVSCLYRVG